MSTMRRDMYQEIFEMLRYCRTAHAKPNTENEQQACLEWISKYAGLWRIKKENALRTS